MHWRMKEGKQGWAKKKSSFVYWVLDCSHKQKLHHYLSQTGKCSPLRALRLAHVWLRSWLVRCIKAHWVNGVPIKRIVPLVFHVILSFFPLKINWLMGVRLWKAKLTETDMLIPLILAKVLKYSKRHSALDLMKTYHCWPRIRSHQNLFMHLCCVALLAAFPRKLKNQAVL